jgi:hypothetical protein
MEMSVKPIFLDRCKSKTGDPPVTPCRPAMAESPDPMLHKKPGRPKILAVTGGKGGVEKTNAACIPCRARQEGRRSRRRFRQGMPDDLQARTLEHSAYFAYHEVP